MDERLDRLTGRHEALTKTVEITAAMQRDNKDAITQLIPAVQADTENSAR